MRIEAELAFGAAAFVVGIPCAACDQELVRVLLAGGRCPFPEISVHVVHAVPAAALRLASASLCRLCVGIAFVLTIAVAVRVLEAVFTAACRLPFFDAAKVLAFVLADACGFFLAYHVLGRCVGLVRVFVGIYADCLSANRDGEGVLSAEVVACHVVFRFFPSGAVADGVGCVKEYGACFIVIDALACVLRIERVANRNKRLALDFVALDFELDGVVVTSDAQLLVVGESRKGVEGGGQ